MKTYLYRAQTNHAVVLFQAFPASWGIISRMLVLATPSSTVHKTKYLDPYH